MRSEPVEPDPEIVRRWQAGDRGAFEQLVRQWQEPIHRLVTRLTGDPHRSRDIVQDVFLKLFLAPGAYRERGQFRPWLFRVVLNRVRDLDRAHRRRPAVPWNDEDLPQVGEPPENGPIRHETAQMVIAALDTLSAGHREVVVLKHYEEMNFEDMARVLMTPATTLKSRFAVAMTQLRQEFIRCGLQPENDHESATER